MDKEFAILKSIIIGGVGGATLASCFIDSIIVIFILSLLGITFMLYCDKNIIFKRKN